MNRQLALICASLCIANAIHAQEVQQEGQSEKQKEVQVENSAPAQAASAPNNSDKNEAPASVVIASMKNPALKPYRIMAAGMETYEEYKALAPDAPLYFKLSRRKGTKEAAVPWQEIKMRLASDDESKQIPIMENGRFVLEKNDKAYEENAELILNQRKSSFSFRPDIRTPGLANHIHRMGDLHLNCKMTVDMAKKEAGFILSSLVTTFLMKINWCETKYQLFSYPLNDWAISMKTTMGDQQSVQSFRGTHFNPAFWDKNISPDTLYAFELWSSLSKERQREVIDQQQFVIRSNNKKNPLITPLIKDQQRYQADIAISELGFQFRIDTDKGVLAFANADEKRELKPDQNIALKLGEASHSLQLTQKGMYRFTLDLNDPEHPSFHVQRIGETSAQTTARPNFESAMLAVH